MGLVRTDLVVNWNWNWCMVGGPSTKHFVLNIQGGDLGCSCSGFLLELPVCLVQGMIWERAVKVSYSQSN